MSDKTGGSLNSPLLTSLLLMILYYLFLIFPSLIVRLFFRSSSYLFFILLNTSVIFCSMIVLWFIIVPYGIYLPDDQKTIQVYINDIHLGKESFKPFKLIILISIGWVGLILVIALTVSYFTRDFRFSLDFLLKKPVSESPSWLIFVLALIPGIWEEVAFRGVILKYYERKYQEETPVILYNGILFGIFHLGNLLLGANLFYTIIQVIYATLIGMYLALMRIKTERLYFCILTHYLLDVLFFLFIYYV